jgi:uncharacterized repeat protein (TIGR02543 family)
VPSDVNLYHSGDTATILGNLGNLSKTGYIFSGWISDTTGTGINYFPADRVTITDTLILYAKWINNSTNPASQNSNLNCGGNGWTNAACASSASLTLKATYGTIEVTLSFNTIPTTGSYSVSSLSNPSNVQVTVLNAPNQPWGIAWFGKTGVVNVNNTSNSISATFSGVLCTQANYNFPVVSLSGSASCN